MSEYQPKRGDIVRVKTLIETAFSLRCGGRLAIVTRTIPPDSVWWSAVSLRFPDETIEYLCRADDLEPTGESCALDTP